jgi:2Fe-2S ferredoxin
MTMIKIHFIEHNGTEHVVEGHPGQSVMQVALDYQVPGILADCSGCLTCGTCHGYVDDAWMGRVPPAKSDERELLEGLLNTTPNSRVTCQISLTEALDGLVVRLPASQI